MGLGLGAKCAKYLLFTFNLIFFLGGMSALAIGIWMIADSEAMSKMVSIVDGNEEDGMSGLGDDSNSNTVVKQCAIMLIVSGSFVFIVAFMGCFGAFREMRILLVLYAISLIIILGVLVAAGIYAAVFSTEAEEKFQSGFRQAVEGFYDGDKARPLENHTQWTNETAQKVNAFTATLNVIMIKFECCGIDNYTDFTENDLSFDDNSKYFINGIVPMGCCILTEPGDWENPKVADTQCQVDPQPGVNINKKGCYLPVKAWMKSNLAIFAGVGIGIGLIQIFGVILAIALCYAIGQDDYEEDD